MRGRRIARSQLCSIGGPARQAGSIEYERDSKASALGLNSKAMT